MEFTSKIGSYTGMGITSSATHLFYEKKRGQIRSFAWETRKVNKTKFRLAHYLECRSLVLDRTDECYYPYVSFLAATGQILVWLVSYIKNDYYFEPNYYNHLFVLSSQLELIKHLPLDRESIPISFNLVSEKLLYINGEEFDLSQDIKLDLSSETISPLIFYPEEDKIIVEDIYELRQMELSSSLIIHSPSHQYMVLHEEGRTNFYLLTQTLETIYLNGFNQLFDVTFLPSDETTFILSSYNANEDTTTAILYQLRKKRFNVISNDFVVDGRVRFVFSPNGKHLAVVHFIDSLVKPYLDVYNFDSIRSGYRRDPDLKLVLASKVDCLT